jgi:hypothetical protein
MGWQEKADAERGFGVCMYDTFHPPTHTHPPSKPKIFGTGYPDFGLFEAKWHGWHPRPKARRKAILDVTLRQLVPRFSWFFDFLGQVLTRVRNGLMKEVENGRTGRRRGSCGSCGGI